MKLILYRLILKNIIKLGFSFLLKNQTKDKFWSLSHHSFLNESRLKGSASTSWSTSKLDSRILWRSILILPRHIGSVLLKSLHGLSIGIRIKNCAEKESYVSKQFYKEIEK